VPRLVLLHWWSRAKQFLSVKTVEMTLTKTYRKLGIRSRAQLPSRLDDLDACEG
jgi:DNA-binding NarL/FixJ family response regulator